MIVIRRTQMNDIEAIHRLANSGVVGITTLPKDIELLRKRVMWACDSFDDYTTPHHNYYYLFVAEDMVSGQIVGTSAIETGLGYESPFYSFKLSAIEHNCERLNIHRQHHLLYLVNDFYGASEICTLFLHPDYRINGNGLLLSRARFLFMAQFTSLFNQKVIAEMRGLSDEKGISPFWDAVGQQFIPMSFTEADEQTLYSKQFIADLMPHSPIYTHLLSPEAQQAMGKPHILSAPALAILEREGFFYNHYIDIFDGGPTVEADINKIYSVIASQLVKVKQIAPLNSSEKSQLIANTSLDFRAVQAPILFKMNNEECQLTPECADNLDVSVGDFIRVAPLKLPPH